MVLFSLSSAELLDGPVGPHGRNHQNCDLSMIFHGFFMVYVKIVQDGLHACDTATNLACFSVTKHDEEIVKGSQGMSRQ